MQSCISLQFPKILFMKATDSAVVRTTLVPSREACCHDCPSERSHSPPCFFITLRSSIAFRHPVASIVMDQALGVQQSKKLRNRYDFIALYIWLHLTQDTAVVITPGRHHVQRALVTFAEASLPVERHIASLLKRWIFCMFAVNMTQIFFGSMRLCNRLIF